MRIIAVSLGSVFVFVVGLLTVKFWGQSQSYTEYKHPMLLAETQPIEFIKPSYKNLQSEIDSVHNLYLDVTTTQDQKLVLPKKDWPSSVKPIRNSKYEEVKNDVLLLTDLKEKLKSKKIIFNILENTQAIHEIFMFNMQQMGFEKGQNYIVTSPYEAPIKALKELAPALVYGSTQPEILKLVAMQSMYILPAANIRADVIIHPLKIHNQLFFNDEIVAEIKKRFKKIIVGPVNSDELKLALELHPFGVIVVN
jgi:hypothetical protein